MEFLSVARLWFSNCTSAYEAYLFLFGCMHHVCVVFITFSSGAIQEPGMSLEEWGLGNMFVYMSRIVSHPSRKFPLRFFHLLDISGNTNGKQL
ncbi:hypothetical protein JHK86_025913 [Glycine max]|nr:hypothetical protein JHK86_025913 [Glycine max]